MIGIKHTALLLVLFFTLPAPASEPPHKPRHKRSGNGTRINFGTGLNFYTINENHGSDPKQKFGATFGIRRELRISADYKAYFLVGMDYALHGLTYYSYFFKPDSLKLYDKHFNYKYSLSLNELQFPFQFKYLFRREDNSQFSPYFLFGYHLRYMLPGLVKVKDESGNLVKSDAPVIRFKNYLFADQINASVSASLGWQINNLSDYRGSFFGEVNFQYGFSPYYFTSDYSANSMFINCTHVTVLVGFKF